MVEVKINKKNLGDGRDSQIVGEQIYREKIESFCTELSDSMESFSSNNSFKHDDASPSLKLEKRGNSLLSRQKTMSKVLQTDEIKTIIQKNPNKRTDKEMKLLVKLLQSTPFIFEYQQIDLRGLKQLAQCLRFTEVASGQIVEQFDLKRKRLFVLIAGEVSKFVKNQEIGSWNQAFQVYHQLK